MKVKDYFLSKEEFNILPTTIPGVLKTDPVPKNLDKYYQSTEYISHYQDKGSLKEKVYKFAQSFNLNYKRNILNQYFFKYANILDYGSGAGEFLKFIEEYYTTFGYEPNHNARNASKGKLQKTVLINNLKELGDDSLDGITLWHVLEHIENKDEIIQEFYRILKPSGKLILALPNYKSYDAKYYQKYWAAYDVPRHIFHYSKEGVANTFEKTKWSLLKIKPLHLDAIYISIMSEKYKKNLFFLLKGLLIGSISNFKAVKSNEFSSLIYILEKK